HLEPRRHAVERTRERAHPSRTVLGCARAVVAGGDAVRSLHHRSEREAEPSHQSAEQCDEHEQPQQPEENPRRANRDRPTGRWKQPRHERRQSDGSKHQTDGKQNAHSPGEPRAVAAPGVRSPLWRPWLVVGPPWGTRSALYVPHSANLYPMPYTVRM